MSNIYIVKDEDHLGEILSNNKFKIVLTVFTSKINDNNFSLKKWVISTASQFKNSIFLYIDVDNFKTNGLLERMECPISVLATTMIFFKEHPLYIIRGNDVQAIEQCFKETEVKTRKITQHILKNGYPVENPIPPQSPTPITPPPTPSDSKTPQLPQSTPSISLESVQQMIQQSLSQILPQYLQQMQLQLQTQIGTQKITENKQAPKPELKKPDLLNIINKLEAVKKTKQTEEELLKN